MDEEKFDIESMELKPKDVLIVRVTDEFTPEELNNVVQHVSRTINEGVEEGETYMNPVLFLDKDVDLETVSIDQLEHILNHAKSMAEQGTDAQEEVELTNPSSQQKELDRNRDEGFSQEDIEEMHEDLKELIPNRNADQ